MGFLEWLKTLDDDEKIDRKEDFKCPVCDKRFRFRVPADLHVKQEHPTYSIETGLPLRAVRA